MRTPRQMRTAAQKLKRRSGCLVAVVVFLFLILLFGESAQEPQTRDQTNRTPMDASQITSMDIWYQDDWGDWIDGCSDSDRKDMIRDFQYFYTKTGIQPFVWILGENGACIQDENALEEAARDRYDALFHDQGHLLIAFREYPNASGNYICGCFVGASAKSVMDAQAREVLLDAIDACYDRDDYSDAQVFGKALRKTADVLMKAGTEESNPYITLLWLAGFILLIFYIQFLRGRRSEQQAAEMQEQSEQGERETLQKQDESAWRAVQCPNCGASIRIRINTTDMCAYCSSYIHVDEHGHADIAKVQTK